MLQKLRENRSLQGILLMLADLLVMVALLIIPLIADRDYQLRPARPRRQRHLHLHAGELLAADGLHARRDWDDLYLHILLRSLWLALQTTVIVILHGLPAGLFHRPRARAAAQPPALPGAGAHCGPTLSFASTPG